MPAKVLLSYLECTYLVRTRMIRRFRARIRIEGRSGSAQLAKFDQRRPSTVGTLIERELWYLGANKSPSSVRLNALRVARTQAAAICSLDTFSHFPRHFIGGILVARIDTTRSIRNQSKALGLLRRYGEFLSVITVAVR